MAPHNSQEFRIKIKNKNSEAITVYITPDKSNVIFCEGNTKIVKGNSEVNFVGLYISPVIGYYTIELKIIFNYCALVIVNVLANVCPASLKLKSDRIVFTEENVTQYLEINNPLSTDAFFKWSLTCNNFSIEPLEGHVKGNDSLMCYVQYFPDREGPTTVYADLSTCGIYTEQLRLTVQLVAKKLFFMKPKLHFKDIPLNISILKKIPLKNDSDTIQYYSLIKNDFKDYVDIFPSKGVVYPKSYIILLITVKLTSCVHFLTTLKFAIGKEEFLDLTLSGNVVYPNIVTTPTILNFNKIPASTTNMLKFTIRNESDAIAKIKFSMSMYPEFSITETDNYWDLETVGTIQLEKHSSIQLYIRFAPYARTIYGFILPIVINDILGPIDNATTARRMSCYLIDNVLHSSAVPIPTMLPITTVQCQATEAKIRFSKTLINLSYAPPPNKCKPHYELKISNEQAETEEKFCIRTDDLAYPFYITYLRGKQIAQHNRAIVCSLLPKEEVFFKLSFHPDRVGIYKCLLPVYIRSDHSDTPHNYLRIKGTSPLPTITCVNPVIYFKTLPLKVQAVTTTQFVLENHFENCKVECTSTLLELEVEVCNQFLSGRNTQELCIEARIRSQRSLREYCNISIACSCGGNCNVPAYLVTENCFFTNYAFVYSCIMNPLYNLGLNKNISLSTMV